jgi:hypothetical protein
VEQVTSKEAVEKLTAELTASREAVEKLTTEQATSNMAVEKHTAELAASNTTVEMLTAEQVTSSTAVEKLTAELATSNAAGAPNAELADGALTAQLARSNEHINELHQRLNRSDAEVAKHKSALTGIRISALSAELRGSMTDSQIQEVIASIAAEQAQIKDSLTALGKQLEDSIAVSVERDRFKAIVDHLEGSKVLELYRKVEALEEKLRNGAGNSTPASVRAMQLKWQYIEISAMGDKTPEEASELIKSQHNRALFEIKDLEEGLKDIEQKRAGDRQQISQLLTKCNKLQQDLDAKTQVCSRILVPLKQRCCQYRITWPLTLSFFFK